jgi:hypothetical protein
MPRIATKETTIEVEMNGRIWQGIVRKDSAIPSRILIILFGEERTTVYRLRVKKNGHYHTHALQDYFTKDEEMALLYKLYRWIEKQMEIL